MDEAQGNIFRESCVSHFHRGITSRQHVREAIRLIVIRFFSRPQSSLFLSLLHTITFLYKTTTPIMHPPLDRPHPDCQDVIDALKSCHLDSWKKYTGGCNAIKRALDNCFKLEKERLLKDLTKDLPNERKEAEDIVKQAFGRQETFQEFLARDKEYQKAMQAKKEKAAAVGAQ